MEKTIDSQVPYNELRLYNIQPAIKYILRVGLVAGIALILEIISKIYVEA